VNLLPVLCWAVASAVAAAGADPWLRRQLPEGSRLAGTWLQVPVAAVLGGLAGLAPSLLEQVTFAVLAVAGALLVVVDYADYRLPDVIVLPLYGVLAVLLTATAWTQDLWPDLLRAGIVAVAMFVLYFVMAMFAPDLGFGDVKLAGVAGGFLGWFGIAEPVAGFLLAWVLMAVVGLVLLLLRRVGRKASLPFGPYLIAGAVLGALFGARMFPVLAGLTG
jgi:leader peptidase (prepilin peptidase)/N-methyltransferase